MASETVVAPHTALVEQIEEKLKEEVKPAEEESILPSQESGEQNLKAEESPSMEPLLAKTEEHTENKPIEEPPKLAHTLSETEASSEDKPIGVAVVAEAVKTEDAPVTDIPLQENPEVSQDPVHEPDTCEKAEDKPIGVAVVEEDVKTEDTPVPDIPVKENSEVSQDPVLEPDACEKPEDNPIGATVVEEDVKTEDTPVPDILVKENLEVAQDPIHEPEEQPASESVEKGPEDQPAIESTNKQPEEQAATEVVEKEPEEQPVVEVIDKQPEEQPATEVVEKEPEEQLVMEVIDKQPEEQPKIGDVIEKAEEQPKIGDVIEKAEEQPKIGDVIEKVEEQPKIGDVIEKAEELLEVSTVKEPEPAVPEVELKPEEQPEEVDNFEKKCEEVDSKENVGDKSGQEEPALTDNIGEAMILKEEFRKDPESFVSESPDQVASTNQETQADVKGDEGNCIPSVVEEAGAETINKEGSGTNVVEELTKEVAVELGKVKEGNEEKNVINKVSTVPPEAEVVNGPVSTAEVTDEFLEGETKSRDVELDLEDKKEDIKDDVPALIKTNEEMVTEGQLAENITVGEETVKAEADEVKKEQTDENVKSDLPKLEPSTEVSDDTKTSRDLPEEAPVKPIQKQTNNIMTKVKKSLVKAKKAILGKSPSAKTVTTESKEGDIEVK